MTMPGWRPFYWNDCGNDWIYRAASTVGLACATIVVGLLLVALVSAAFTVAR